MRQGSAQEDTNIWGHQLSRSHWSASGQRSGHSQPDSSNTELGYFEGLQRIELVHCEK